MEFAKTYWFLNDKINQPRIDYYQYSNKTPYERGIEALDYFRYYGGKPLNIEKTYYNRLLMPIFDDLDLFQLNITNIFVKFKEFQGNFNQDETIKDLKNLNKTIVIIVKEIIKHRKNQIKSIIEELKLTKKGIKSDIKEIFLSRKMLLPFVQYMQIRELNAQERNENIKLKFKINSNKVRNLRENMLVQENLIEKMEAKKEVERFNDYLISFKKSLESRARNMKIERLKMKINDVQMNLEKEMKNKDIINVRTQKISYNLEIKKISGGYVYFNFKMPSIYAFEQAEIALYINGERSSSVPINYNEMISDKGFDSRLRLEYNGIYELKVENIKYNGHSETHDIGKKFIL